MVSYMFISSELLNKPPEQLVMNQADSYRNTQELRYLVDRTIPCMDYGKGCEYMATTRSRIHLLTLAYESKNKSVNHIYI